MAGRGMRVLLVGRGSPERGGIAAFVDLIMKSRLARDHELDFLNLTPRERGSGGRVTGANLGRTARDVVAVWRAARGRDIVHLHSALVPLATLIRAGALASVARLRGARVVVHAHGGLVPLWLTTPARRRAARVALAAASRVVTVSSGGRDSLGAALGTSRVVHVANGIDTNRFGPRSGTNGPPRILFVGILTERKGVGDLLAASEELRRRGVEHELALAGGTPDEGRVAAERIRDTAGAGASFLGEIDQAAMPDVYASADVFCLPSWWEAMPLSILEAMAAGLPVVATRVGDVEDLVVDGVTGLLVEPRDPAALVEALETVLTDPDRAAAMGAAGRRRVVERFDLSGTVESLDALYRTLAG